MEIADEKEHPMFEILQVRMEGTKMDYLRMIVPATLACSLRARVRDNISSATFS